MTAKHDRGIDGVQAMYSATAALRNPLSVSGPIRTWLRGRCSESL
jgi:hypothetical protein